MTLLPVVERELRVAARRKGTYRLRCLAAALALVLGSITYLWSGFVGPAQIGLHVFTVLCAVTFGFSLIAGIMISGDCLSVEKREGTLGLLFLTDLKSYDVALGKLTAVSLHAVFGLVAIFPVLGLPLVLGGITGGEFARLLLVFGASLFFSLNLGLLVSALSHDPREAFARGLAGVAAITGGFPLLRLLAPAHSRIGDILFWPSPACAYFNSFEAEYATPAGAVSYWVSLILILSLGLLFLVRTIAVLPRSVQHSSGSKSPRDATRTRELRGALGTANPIRWLAEGDRSAYSQVWGILAIVGGLWLVLMAASLLSSLRKHAFAPALIIAYVMHELVKLIFVAEAVQRMHRERQEGRLELILVTPMTTDELIAGHWQALSRHFRGAFIALGAINLAMAFAVAGFGDTLGFAPDTGWVLLLLLGGGALLSWLDFHALGLVGMWMGLKARASHRATLAALTHVMGIPWLVTFFLLGTQAVLAMPAAELGAMVISLVAFGVMIDVHATSVTRKKLQSEFREVATQQFQPAN